MLQYTNHLPKYIYIRISQHFKKYKYVKNIHVYDKVHFDVFLIKQQENKKYAI